MLCGVVDNVLECLCGVVEAGLFAMVSGLHMLVILVGSLCGNVPGLVFLLLLYCHGLLYFYE
jgi:hypothetical protein